jgi:hypothetical protein
MVSNEKKVMVRQLIDWINNKKKKKDESIKFLKKEILVEAFGIEPKSETKEIKASTCLVSLFMFQTLSHNRAKLLRPIL